MDSGSARTGRKESLEQLIDLAQVYAGVTRKELARMLGRDPTKIVPRSRNPKLDLVKRLADVLDWSVEGVAECLDCGMERVAPDRETFEELDFQTLDAMALDAHGKGEYALMKRLGRAQYEVAETPRERALACIREFGGWDGMGRYTKALDAARRGLREPGVEYAYRLVLESNLANAHYALWNLVDARAVASDLVEWFAERGPQTRINRQTQAFAYYVRGNAARRMLADHPPKAEDEVGERERIENTQRAQADLEKAEGLYTELADEFESDSLAGIARTCRGGLIEIKASLGDITVTDAIDEIMGALDDVVETGDWPIGDMLESHGWWCIFGCNIALRHLSMSDVQRPMAILTNKAYDIAERLDNWAMRERVFTMELARRRRLDHWTGIDNDWPVDDEELRVLAGTMGRFPGFRTLGWDILQRVKVVGGS